MTATTALPLSPNASSFRRNRLPSNKILPFKKRRHDISAIFPKKPAALPSYKSAGSACQQQQQTYLNAMIQHRRHLLAVRQAQQQAKPKKQVRFAPTATVTTRHASTTDLQASWYAPEQYKSFEHENRETVRLYQAGILPNHSATHSILGLEHYVSRESMSARRNLTLRHSAMVLELYDLQKTSGMFSPDMVRQLSERYSREGVQRAHWKVRAATAA